MDKPSSDPKPPTLPESEARVEPGRPGSGQTPTLAQKSEAGQPAAQSGGEQSVAEQPQTGQPGGGQTPAPEQKPGGRKRYGENLRHLLDQKEEDEAVVTDSLSNKMGVMFDKFQSRPAKKKKDERIPPKELLLQFARKVLQETIKHKKAVAWSVVGIIGLIAAVYITPLISLQVERSAGFVAFEEESYPEAQRALVSYLNKRPHDHQAMYYAAQAALYNGDLRYAHDTFGRLYDAGAVLSTNDLPYFYALVNLDRPKEVLQILERWLASSPNALAGRFLRGVLLIGQPEAKRKMREDFLYVDDLIQRAEDSNEQNKILFLHDYFQKSGKFSAVLSPPLSSQTDTTGLPVANALRFNPGADGFIGKYNLSGGPSFLRDNLSPAAIVNLYFAYGLMAVGDSQEAEVELKELQQEASNSPSLRQALAFLALYQGRHTRAAEIFSALSQQSGDDPQTLNNLAVALWSAGGEEVEEITAIYDNILKQGNRDRVAINNGAFLEILTGDHTAAASRLGNLESDESFQYTLNLGLIELWRNQPKRAFDLFSSIPTGDFPAINYYLAAVLEKSGNDKDAIAIYRQIEEDSPNNSQAAFLRRIRLMFRRGDWRLAYSDLSAFLRENADNAEAWYYRGLLALQLGEENVLEAAKTMLADLSEDWHYLNALRGAQFRRDGENRRAATAFQTAMEGAPNGWTETDYAAAWGEMAVTESPQKVADTLLPMLEANINPEFNPELAAVLARALAGSRPNLAREIVEAAISIPPSVMTAKNAGLVFIRLGEAERAVELLQTAYQWMPTNEMLLRTLIEAQTAAKDSEGIAQSEAALSHLLLVKRGEPPISNIEYKVFLPQVREIIKKVQDYINGETDVGEVLAEYQNQLAAEESKVTPALLLYSQATFYMYLDRLPEALESFRAALSKKFSDPQRRVQAMLFYAEAHAKARQYQEALDVLAQLIEAEGETPLYARLVADNLARLRRDTEAQQHLSDAIKRYPDDGLLYLELAHTHYNKNELETALQVAERMIRVAPNFVPGYEMLIEIHTALQQPALARAYAHVKAELEDASR